MFGFGKKKTLILKAPITGKAVPLAQVPDPTFAEKLVGDGGAIEPTEGLLVAPCDGTVEMIFPMGHALALSTKDGVEILLHLGIDTVEMKGAGFEKLVEQGATVTEGQPLIRFNLDTIRAAGKSVISPVLITNVEVTKSIESTSGDLTAGKTPFITVVLA